VFCEICKEEVQKDNTPLACFNIKGYKHLEEKFFATIEEKISLLPQRKTHKEAIQEQMGHVEYIVYPIHGVENCRDDSWVG
jgi:hypothetical protein